MLTDNSMMGWGGWGSIFSELRVPANYGPMVKASGKIDMWERTQVSSSNKLGP